MTIQSGFLFAFENKLKEINSMIDLPKVLEARKEIIRNPFDIAVRQRYDEALKGCTYEEWCGLYEPFNKIDEEFKAILEFLKSGIDATAENWVKFLKEKEEQNAD